MTVMGLRPPPNWASMNIRYSKRLWPTPAPNVWWVSGHMDLKALAAAVGAKKAAMADPKVAMRESGYVVGGISPLGQRTHHKTVLDESALQYGEILLSGGKRGFSIGINPNDLLKVLDGIAAPIGTW